MMSQSVCNVKKKKSGIRVIFYAAWGYGLMEST